MSNKFKVGDRVRIARLPAFVKTADPMPMLRPATVISLGEEGIVMEQRFNDSWSVRLANGTFLIDGNYLDSAVDAN